MRVEDGVARRAHGLVESGTTVPGQAEGRHACRFAVHNLRLVEPPANDLHRLRPGRVVARHAALGDTRQVVGLRLVDRPGDLQRLVGPQFVRIRQSALDIAHRAHCVAAGRQHVVHGLHRPVA
ncbi:hypothetical protein D3C81_864660 [compost metagenome]